jgi:glycerol-3-phosphate dehydrogenase (NAD(P)+)
MAEDKGGSLAILGAGNWGTTLAVMLAARGHRVRLWEYRPELAADIEKRRENSLFLPGVPLPEKVTVTSDLAAALAGVYVCLLAVPSQTMRQVCVKMAPRAEPDILIVSCVKGLEHGSLLRMSQVIKQCLSEKPCRLAALSGPNIASEIAQGMPATAVAAGESQEAAAEAQNLLHSTRYRVYTSSDLPGVELGGALKNIYAIAAGIVDGLGLGANTQGALLTRGLAEMVRLGQALGARAETFSGLSGLGDLVTTCISGRSRNRQVGLKIGQGKSLAEVLEGMTMVAEGVPTTRSAWELARKHGVDMPITGAVHQILFEGKSPREAIGELMAREAKAE